MGAGARKINNARSKQIFDQASEGYKSTLNAGDAEGRIKGMLDDPGADQALRSRLTRPIQAAYSGDLREMDRAARISGGAPNLIAARAKSGRDRSQALSDAYGDAESSIYDRKMSGLGMLGGLEQGRKGLGLGYMGAQMNAPRHEGFNWSGLANLGMGIGSAFMMRPGGGNSRAYAPTGG